MDEGQSCDGCRYWAPIWSLKSERRQKRSPTSLRARSKRGVCRRYPARPSALTQFWPVTDADFWCGEFAPRENERGTLEAATDDENLTGDASGRAKEDEERS